MCHKVVFISNCTEVLPGALEKVKEVQLHFSTSANQIEQLMMGFGVYYIIWQAHPPV